MSNRVAIIGVGMCKFGELWEQNLQDITLEAGMYAIFDSGVRGSDIDGVVIGNMSAGRFTGHHQPDTGRPDNGEQSGRLGAPGRRHPGVTLHRT